MFAFTWARLGIFFAIFLGIPLLIFLIIAFANWVEEHLTAEMAGGCLLAVILILLAILAGYVAFFIN